MADKAAQIDYYEKLLNKHGANYKALDWNSTESQRLRYKILKEIFIYGRKSSNVSVLDVGCGFGDFYGYLKAEGVVFCYTGYDISAKLLAVARKKYPDAKFELRDILADRQVPKFDYIFCSGVFNIRTSEEEAHLDFVKEMLFRMRDLAGCGVAANFLSEGALPVDAGELNSGRYYYFRPEEIVSLCRHDSGRFILRHDYHAGDFTVFLLK